MPRSSHRAVVALIFLAGLLSGCGKTPRPQSAEERNLKALAILVGRYRGSHKGQPPANLDALKAFLKGAGEKTATSMGLNPSDLDGSLTSSRDGKAFVYRKPTGSGIPGGPASAPAHVLFHEAIGAAGTRWVAYELGGTEQVDAAKFKSLVPESP